MLSTLEPSTQGSTQEYLYDPAMPKTEPMGVEALRKVLGTRIKEIKTTELHTVVTIHGKPEAVVVPMEWYRQARESMGEPTDL